MCILVDKNMLAVVCFLAAKVALELHNPGSPLEITEPA